MRYIESDQQILVDGKVPNEISAAHASDNMLVLTSIMGFFIGFILFYLGRIGKQMYLWIWGIGLVFVSVYLGLSVTGIM